MNYKEYTDKYFLRSKEILEKCEINPVVRYQVFVRKGGLAWHGGIQEAIEFIRGIVGDKVKIFTLNEGAWVEPCEPVMKLEGRVQDLIDLETVYLGIISSGFTGWVDLRQVRKDAIEIVEAAEGKPVMYFGARHFHYNLDASISQICKDAGFVGCSTDVGAKAWGNEGLGTIPHALIIAVGVDLKEKCLRNNVTVETALLFNTIIAKGVGRTVLIDTFNREITDSIAVAKAMPNLYGVRIDTCGENYVEEYGTLTRASDALPGVSLDGVWRLKIALKGAGFEKVKIVVSSGFNAEKIRVFVTSDKVFQLHYGTPLFDSVGTGSLGNPVMATSDIVSYFSEKENKWIPFSKVGRGERESERLVEIK